MMIHLCRHLPLSRAHARSHCRSPASSPLWCSLRPTQDQNRFIYTYLCLSHSASLQIRRLLCGPLCARLQRRGHRHVQEVWLRGVPEGDRLLLGSRRGGCIRYVPSIFRARSCVALLFASCVRCGPFLGGARGCLSLPFCFRRGGLDLRLCVYVPVYGAAPVPVADSFPAWHSRGGHGNLSRATSSASPPSLLTGPCTQRSSGSRVNQS